MPTAEQIQNALSRVIDPELRKDIVSLGMVRSVDQPEPGRVDVVVSLTTPGCPIRNHFQQAVAQNLSALEGVSQVNVGFDVLSDQEKQSLAQRLGRQGGLPEGALARVKNVICVGSGKGGVGKSTITANLASALQADGMLAAALDADVWGYSIPRMLGVHGRPQVSAERKILPLETPDYSPSIYGRFDLRYDGAGPAKLLEYNADTPTTLLEASILQWNWLKDTHEGDDQWNSLHEKLVERVTSVRLPTVHGEKIVIRILDPSSAKVGIEALGYEKEPLVSGYFTYLGQIVRGDFGISTSNFPSPVTEVIGTSSTSWEEAAKNAVETAAKTLRDLRVGEVVKFDVTIEDGKVTEGHWRSHQVPLASARSTIASASEGEATPRLSTP